MLAINNPAFTAFTQHYLAIMKTLNSTQTKTEMAAQLNPNYNQTDLFSWQQTRMVFAQDTTGWLEDPIKILNSGRRHLRTMEHCLRLGMSSTWLPKPTCSGS